MLILYVGNFSQPHCTEVHVANTLEDLGHQVLRIQENELQPDGLVSLCYGNSPDLVLYTRTWGNYVTMDDLRRIKELDIPTASYHLDLYVGIKREEGLKDDPFWHTDYVFTPDGDPKSAKFFKERGINHYYIRPGVYKPECVDGNFREELSHDVVFVGGGVHYGHNEWPYRRELVTWLKNTYGDRYGKYGHPEPTMRNQDLNDLYASSKVVIGDSLCLNFTHENYWSDRVYETIGRGGFIIHPYIKGMEEEFTDGESIVFYEFGNFQQLKEKIDYYIQHNEARNEIRRAGQELVRENYTYHNRLTEAMSIIEKDLEAQKLAKVAYDHIDNSGFSINLGSGQDPKEGYVNVDFLDLPEVDVVHNLMQFPYPFDDNSAKEITAVDVVEHLANYTGDGKPSVIAFIEECHRILKPGGELFIQTPRYDAEFLWIDPTHVRGFHEESFDFFDPEKHYGQTTGFYSKAKFSVRHEILPNKNLRFWMKKL